MKPLIFQRLFCLFQFEKFRAALLQDEYGFSHELHKYHRSTYKLHNDDQYSGALLNDRFIL